MCIFHKWSKWADNNLVRCISDGKPIGYILIQQKRCKKCDKIKFRRAKV